MQDLAIDITGLRKVFYPNNRLPGKAALDGVSLQIPKGSIYGLLGPNGAGKSTLINIMAGLVFRSAGNVRIWGIDTLKDPRNAKCAIGVVPQEINYDPFFTPSKLLDIQAGLYGVPRGERRTAELLELVGLTDKSKAYTRTLSGGMKRRLMVAKAMVHSPPILVLDEPTAGVDVELRQQMWQNIRDLNQRGVTVLLTTHYLQEAEELCDRIAIIHHGKIIIDDKKDVLLSRIDSKEITFYLDRAVRDMPPDALGGHPFEKKGDQSITVRYKPRETAMGDIVARIQSAGYAINDISTRQGSLEDVFLQMTSSG